MEPLGRIGRILSAIRMDNVLKVRLNGPPFRKLSRVVQLEHCLVIAHDHGRYLVLMERRDIRADLGVGDAKCERVIGTARDWAFRTRASIDVIGH